MTYTEITELVESLGLPYAYYQFPDGTAMAPPFICFLFDRDDIYADNSNYVGLVSLSIELYTDYRDIDKELEIEARLAAAGMSFGQQVVYIESERMYQTTYTMEVLINAE